MASSYPSSNTGISMATLIYNNMQQRTDNMEISKNNISIAGEFAVLAQLALRGIDANLTLGNTKSVDIIASDPSTGKMFKLEVKTSYDSKPTISKLYGQGHTLNWVMAEKHETIRTQICIIVSLTSRKKPIHLGFLLFPA
jgi:hypothetical protein